MIYVLCIFLFLILFYYTIIKINNLSKNINYSDYEIICARYIKDTSFLNNFKIKSNIIQKCIDNSCNNNTCPNIGNEASSYLFYIINNWNKLPKNLIFIHDENSSWHHNGNITDNLSIWIKEYEDNGSIYYEFNSMTVDPTIIYNADSNKEPGFQKFYSENLEEYLGKWTDLPLKPRKCCAQFIVSRKQIKKNPLQMYVKIYNWIINDKLEDHNDKTEKEKSYIKGLYCEFTWNFIFTRK